MSRPTHAAWTSLQGRAGKQFLLSRSCKSFEPAPRGGLLFARCCGVRQFVTSARCFRHLYFQPVHCHCGRNQIISPTLICIVWLSLRPARSPGQVFLCPSWIPRRSPRLAGTAMPMRRSRAPESTDTLLLHNESRPPDPLASPLRHFVTVWNMAAFLDSRQESQTREEQ